MQPRQETMNFTERLIALQTLLEKIDSQRKDELMAKLRQLRRYSDIAEIIGHPKNDNVKVGGTTEAIEEAQHEPDSRGEKLRATEHQQYHEFRNALTDIQRDILEEVRRVTGQDFTRELRDIFNHNDPQQHQQQLSDIYARLDSGQFRQTR